MRKKKLRVIFNYDSDTLRRIPLPHDVQKVSLAVDYLKKTHVDCRLHGSQGNRTDKERPQTFRFRVYRPVCNSILSMREKTGEFSWL